MESAPNHMTATAIEKMGTMTTGSDVRTMTATENKIDWFNVPLSH